MVSAGVRSVGSSFRFMTNKPRFVGATVWRTVGEDKDAHQRVAGLVVDGVELLLGNAAGPFRRPGCPWRRFCLMARLSGAGPPRQHLGKKFESRLNDEADLRVVGGVLRRDDAYRARAAADPPKRALRRDRTRDPGGWRFRRDAPSGGARDARGREAGGVERESRRGHICVCSVCGGGGKPSVRKV